MYIAFWDDDTDERFEECAKRIVEEVMNRIQQKPIKQLLLERLELLVLRKTSATPDSPSQIDLGNLTPAIPPFAPSGEYKSNDKITRHIALLRDGSAEGKTNAAWALLNLAADNADNQVCIARESGIKALIALLRNGSTEGKTNAAAALRNLAFNVNNKRNILWQERVIQTAYESAAESGQMDKSLHNHDVKRWIRITTEQAKFIT